MEHADLLSTDTPRVCLRTVFLRERCNLPNDWEWVSMQVIDHKGKDPKDWEYTRYDGGVYPNKITRGPRKGKTNRRKPAPGTEASFVISDREFREWIPTWEAKTGKCHQCSGTGQEWAGWDHKDGHRYRDCQRCSATGKPSAIGGVS